MNVKISTPRNWSSLSCFCICCKAPGWLLAQEHRDWTMQLQPHLQGQPGGRTPLEKQQRVAETLQNPHNPTPPTQVCTVQKVGSIELRSPPWVPGIQPRALEGSKPFRPQKNQQLPNVNPQFSRLCSAPSASHIPLPRCDPPATNANC